VLKILTGRGLLVGSYDAAGKANLMTIGWGSIGNIWGVPLWIVLVRPSRYTYQCIEHSGCFTVNVPPEGLSMACAVCGSQSGRDADKFAACKLTAARGVHVLAPTVEECPIIYECQVVHSNDVVPAKLIHEIRSGMYISGDFHRVYFGKILAAYAAPDAAELLRK
jgi:flavin reductase (DIM6/NTAB) family NADH-FMN oxidoreductase RutF